MTEVRDFAGLMHLLDGADISRNQRYTAGAEVRTDKGLRIIKEILDLPLYAIDDKCPVAHVAIFENPTGAVILER